MSGFGGFGFGANSNNNQPQNTGFGFGANNTANTGFGTPGNTTFGNTNNSTTGGLFGGGGSTSSFGNSGGAFGTPTNNAFGAKPNAFGATTSAGTSLFGGGTATAGSTGFGGFGSTPAATSSPFGTNNNAGSSLFGGNKPAFGSNTTTSSPFGGGATSSFGGNTTGAFGSPASTALGATTGECQGTGSVPFQPFIEKEPNSSTNQQNSFQSICFQQPYQKFSPEELRLADYNQGRKFGNASNQAGAFGASNFGGFGSNNATSTGFGATNTNTGSNLFGGGASNAPFGTSQPASTGFGANTTSSGNLFGAKPAGGLFGSQPAAQPSGGLFGNTNSTGFGSNTTGGFGATNNNNNTGTSLFGNTAKPAFSFGGAASTPASTGTGFGSSTTPSTFGSGGSGLFGNSTQQNTTTGFGAQQPAASNTFGGFGSSTTQNTGNTSLFGANQQKPAGTLFGAPASTSTGLFGNTQPAANTNAFGSTNTSTPNSLFGNKPATGGTGLFGSSTTQNNNTGSGLFGGFNQNQNQPATGGSTLFGLGNSNQQKPNLFGSTNSQQQTGLFNTTGNQQQGSNLFGGLNNNQQQQQPNNSLFGGGNSIFNTSQQGQQNQQQSLTASIGDNGAFGSSSLFSNLASTQVNNPGPIATPLSSSVKQKKAPAALPMYKLSTPSASRFSTPTKRGFGFSYSTYGTPGSASSTASTPGAFSGSLLTNGSFNRTLSKSVSTSSLRRSFSTEDSILAPGAFTASSNAQRFGSTGSVKRLNINRSIRHDLFSPPNPPSQQTPPLPSILKKRVSFGANGNGAESPLKQMDNAASPSSEDMGYLRPPPTSSNGSGSGTHGTPQPEMEQVSNSHNQLAIVREEEPAPAVQAPSSGPVSQEDQEPGEYWMKPTKAEIESMSRAQRSKVSDFTVGRKGIGSVCFNVPVDLTKIPVDDIIGNIVQLTVRKATVYANPAKKPPMGQGLNVPAIISLENSWPRKRNLKTPTGEKDGARFKKHIERLKRVPDTKFVEYNKETGVWVFTVEHFTTYGFPEDDEETDVDVTYDFGQSTLSAAPDTPTPKTRTPGSARHDQSFASTSQVTTTESDPDDTFEFKTKRKALPGAFDEQATYVDDEMAEEYDEQNQESFLDERSVGSLSENGVEEPMDQDDVFHDDESVSIVDQEMAGSYPEADNTAELGGDSQDEEDMDFLTETPGAITRARLRTLKSTGTPVKQKFSAGDDWAAALRNTVSPQKQDRALLKSLIDMHGNEPGFDAEPTPMPRRVVSDGRGFATSIDLMNSLFGQARSPVKTAKMPAKPKGFEWPYPKRPKTGDHDMSNMDDNEHAFHDSFKPSWGPDGTLVYAAPPSTKPFGRSSRRARDGDGLLAVQKGGVVSENRDIRFAKFSNEASATQLEKHKELAHIDNSDRVPYASLDQRSTFSDFINPHNVKDPSATHEKLIWQLASILFDDIIVPEELRDVPGVQDRLRKDKLSSFWQNLVEEASSKHVALGRDEEEKAIACLSGHNIADACGHLVNSGDYHLATLVALIGSQDSIRQDMRKQLNDWQKSQILSEFSQPIRAIYEILSGNVNVCDGQKGDLENRTESFVISKRFGLDWRQAFGLRLWYGLSSKEPIDAAVEAFALDLSQDKETAHPVPWYIEQKLPVIWDDRKHRRRQDLLWGLLRLFSFTNVGFEDILYPENSQLSPLDVRLNWQLCQALIASQQLDFTGTNAGKVDSLTLSFAAQLTNEGSWLDAVFVLLHLSDSQAREKALQDHLSRHAGLISQADSQAFTTLIQKYKVPANWVWEAKALYMRSVERDSRAEVECLINAGAYNEAHRTFAREVAPSAIVELDYTTIRNLIRGFSGKEETIAEWHLGGEIYTDFLRLLDSGKHGMAVDDLVLERLLAGLPAVVDEARHPSFMETVAVETISGVVAKTVVAMGKNGEKSNLHKVLRLPLTEDRYLKHTVELSLEYYRGLMASAR